MVGWWGGPSAIVMQLVMVATDIIMWVVLAAVAVGTRGSRMLSH